MEEIQFSVPIYPENTSTLDIIQNLTGLPDFNGLIGQFTGILPRSYTIPSFRAVLHAIIRITRPDSIVEIGTMFAGTSEIICQALAANGHGRLYTIDPFGGDRVPEILETWSASLRQHVDFRAINSMQFFGESEAARQNNELPLFDLIFVDGNHAYEYALFDLMNAARQIKPGGIIILDNYESSGVLRAAADFERDNANWPVVRFSGHPNFGVTDPERLLDNNYRIYIAPKTVTLDTRIRARRERILVDGLRAIKMSFSEPSPAGTFHYKASLTTVPYEFHLGKGDMTESSTSGSYRIDKDMREADINLTVPLVTQTDQADAYRLFDLNIFFEADDGRAKLSLEAEPTLVTFNRDKPSAEETS